MSKNVKIYTVSKVQPMLESPVTTKPKQDATPAFSNVALLARMKTPGTRCSSLKFLLDSCSESWSSDI